MSLTVEMFNSVIMEDTEGKSRLLVDSLRILSHMSLLLNSFKLSKQKHRGILDRMLFALGLCLCSLLGDQMAENGVIDGQPIDVVELLYKFKTHGASDPSIPR